MNKIKFFLIIFSFFTFILKESNCQKEWQEYLPNKKQALLALGGAVSAAAVYASFKNFSQIYESKNKSKQESQCEVVLNKIFNLMNKNIVKFTNCTIDSLYLNDRIIIYPKDESLQIIVNGIEEIFDDFIIHDNSPEGLPKNNILKRTEEITFLDLMQFFIIVNKFDSTINIFLNLDFVEADKLYNFFGKDVDIRNKIRSNILDGYFFNKKENIVSPYQQGGEVFNSLLGGTEIYKADFIKKFVTPYQYVRITFKNKNKENTNKKISQKPEMFFSQSISCVKKTLEVIFSSFNFKFSDENLKDAMNDDKKVTEFINRKIFNLLNQKIAQYNKQQRKSSLNESIILQFSKEKEKDTKEKFAKVLGIKLAPEGE